MPDSVVMPTGNFGFNAGVATVPVTSMPGGGTMVGAGEVPGAGTPAPISSTSGGGTSAWGGILAGGAGDSNPQSKLGLGDRVTEHVQAIMAMMADRKGKNMPDSITPFGMTGIPGSNTGGTNVAVPSSGGAAGASIGSSQSNPLLPQSVTGTATAPINSSVNGAASTFPNVFGVSNPGGGTERVSGGQWTPNQNDFIKAAKKAGYSSADAALLYNFISSGAGYNPQVAQQLVDAMGPGIQRGEQDILEQFSGKGLRGGSPAAIAMGDYLSQVQLNEGQIFAQLYEQSVQNYMNVLMGMQGNKTSTFDNILKWIQTSSQAAAAGAAAAG